jgi:hypothetical protein
MHPTQGVFIGGNPIKDDWSSVGRYRYASQRRDDKHVAKVEQNLVSARDSVSHFKFQGTLEFTSTSLSELDKDHHGCTYQHRCKGDRNQ